MTFIGILLVFLVALKSGFVLAELADSSMFSSNQAIEIGIVLLGFFAIAIGNIAMFNLKRLNR